jgi:hypothetical protein
VLLDCGEGCLARMMLLAQHYHRQASGTRGGGGGGEGEGESGAERAGRTGWQPCGGGAASAGSADIRGGADKGNESVRTGEDCRFKNTVVSQARRGREVGIETGNARKEVGEREGHRQEVCNEEGWHRLLLELRLVWHEYSKVSSIVALHREYSRSLTLRICHRISHMHADHHTGLLTLLHQRWLALSCSHCARFLPESDRKLLLVLACVRWFVCVFGGRLGGCDRRPDRHR